MAKPEKRKKARVLRQEGWAIKAISKEIDIRRDTVSKWCRGIELTPEQVNVLAEDNP